MIIIFCYYYFTLGLSLPRRLEEKWGWNRLPPPRVSRFLIRELVKRQSPLLGNFNRLCLCAWCVPRFCFGFPYSRILEAVRHCPYCICCWLVLAGWLLVLAYCTVEITWYVPSGVPCHYLTTLSANLDVVSCGFTTSRYFFEIPRGSRNLSLLCQMRHLEAHFFLGTED